MKSSSARGSGEECAMNALGLALAVSMAVPIAMGVGDDATRTEGVGERQAREIERSRSGLWGRQNKEPRTYCDLGKALSAV